MLKDFFKLDQPHQVITATDDLVRHFAISDDVKNILYEPELWPPNLKTLKGKKFSNVSFSKKTIEKVTFTECSFKDCLFIGTVFQGVQFHRCKFENCNFYKAKIVGCYWDPQSLIYDDSYKKSHANLGVIIFQQLLKNAAAEDQHTHLMNADIEFRRWKRAQLPFDLKVGKFGRVEYLFLFFKSFLYELICGFGYKPINFIFSTIVLLTVLAVFNQAMLPLAFDINGSSPKSLGFLDSFFYSFSILTSLGLSSVNPITSCAKILAMFEIMIGIGWLALFTSILVKRILR